MPIKTDQHKLLRVIGYLWATKTIKYTITPTKPLAIHAYIDAVFAPHEDSKSHSGVAIFVAGVLVYASSNKQGWTSPTESELVVLTDSLGLVELFEELITSLISENIPIPIIYQDNSSVMISVTQGGGVTMTRHLRSHTHLAKETVGAHRLIIKHCKCKADLMIADGLTKPLDGAEFQNFIQSLMIYQQKTTGERWVIHIFFLLSLA